MTTAQQQAYDAAIFQQATSMGISQAVAQNIVAQARHESGDYTSDVFVHSNNAFGYKYVFPNGSALQTGNYNGYGMYANIQDGAKEMVGWLQRRQQEGNFNINDLTTPDAYATGLKINNYGAYFGDTLDNYINGMKAAFSRINWQTVGVVAGTNTILFIAILAFFLLTQKKKTK